VYLLIGSPRGIQMLYSSASTKNWMPPIHYDDIRFIASE
jgi:hypothetical protein